MKCCSCSFSLKEVTFIGDETSLQPACINNQRLHLLSLFGSSADALGDSDGASEHKEPRIQ